MATTYTNQLSSTDKTLSASQQASIQSYKDAYNAAKAAGDTAGMAAAHQGAESVRASAGYSGGTDGSQTISTGSSSSSSGSSSSGSSGGSSSSGSSSSGSSSSGSSSTTGSTGTVSPTYTVDQTARTGNTVQVGTDGNAPTGTQVGDVVQTAAGDYLVVNPNTQGATYNPTSGLWSVKISSTGSSSGSTSGTTGTTGNSTYTPTGTYLDQGLSYADQQKIASYQAQYEAAKAAGNTQLAAYYHNLAESLRAQYGYSGGTDGSEYIGLETDEDTYNKVGLPVYEAQTDAVNSTYDAAQQYSLAQLKSAYDSSKAELEAALAKIPATYQAQANTLSAEAERQKQAFNESASASGLNSGTGSQAALAMANQYQGNLTTLRTAEANATTDAQNELSQLYVDYQNSIAEAVSKNEYEKAAALLEEYKTRAQSIVDVSQAQANLDLQIYQQNQSTKQYNASQAQQATENLKSSGWTKIQNGIVPNEEELAAMGMTYSQASQAAKIYMYSMQGLY